MTHQVGWEDQPGSSSIDTSGYNTAQQQQHHQQHQQQRQQRQQHLPGRTATIRNKDRIHPMVLLARQSHGHSQLYNNRNLSLAAQLVVYRYINIRRGDASHLRLQNWLSCHFTPAAKTSSTIGHIHDEFL